MEVTAVSILHWDGGWCSQSVKKQIPGLLNKRQLSVKDIWRPLLKARCWALGYALTCLMYLSFAPGSWSVWICGSCQHGVHCILDILLSEWGAWTNHFFVSCSMRMVIKNFLLKHDLTKYNLFRIFYFINIFISFCFCWVIWKIISFSHFQGH